MRNEDKCSNFGINDLKMKRHKYESASRILSVKREGVSCTLHYEHCHTPFTCLPLPRSWMSHITGHHQISGHLQLHRKLSRPVRTGDLISGGGDGSLPCVREIPLVSLIRGGGDGSLRWCTRVCLEIPLVSLIRGGGDGSLRVS